MPSQKPRFKSLRPAGGVQVTKGGGFFLSYQARREARSTIRPLPETRPPIWIYMVFALFVLSVCGCIVLTASLAK